jgi:hypothetical protein
MATLCPVTSGPVNPLTAAIRAAVQAGDERWLHYPQLHFELGDLRNLKSRDEDDLNTGPALVSGALQPRRAGSSVSNPSLPWE